MGASQGALGCGASDLPCCSKNNSDGGDIVKARPVNYPGSEEGPMPKDAFLWAGALPESPDSVKGRSLDAIQEYAGGANGSYRGLGERGGRGGGSKEEVRGAGVDGEETYEDGSSFVGQLREGRRHGAGVWTSASEQYSGQWENDQRDGCGGPSGELLFDSCVKDRQPSPCPMGESTKASSGWDGNCLATTLLIVPFAAEIKASEVSHSQGKFDGQGRMEWRTPNGVMLYEGQYVDDVKHGSGKYVWPDNRMYEGTRSECRVAFSEDAGERASEGKGLRASHPQALTLSDNSHYDSKAKSFPSWTRLLQCHVEAFAPLAPAQEVSAQCLVVLPSRHTKALVASGARGLLRAPAAGKALQVLRAVQSFSGHSSRGCRCRAQVAGNPEVSRAALDWAQQTSSLLDQAWYRGQRPLGRRGRVLLRVSGALLGVAAQLCNHLAVSGEQLASSCVAVLGSRAMELLRRAGAHYAADGLFQQLSSGSVAPAWVHPWQTPARFVRGLRSRPTWSRAELEAEGPDTAAARIAAALEDNFPRILEDLGRIRRRGRWPAAYGPELIQEPQNWTKFLLYHGDLFAETAPPPGLPFERYQKRQLHAGLCETLTRNTCELLRELLPGLRHPELAYLQPDHEQVAFFRLKPGSRINFHQASQNGRQAPRLGGYCWRAFILSVRLTLHLCLRGCGGSSRIQVGPRVMGWTQGRVIAFDDSYLHRVRIDPAKDRWILHVMTMHPGIDNPEKLARAVGEGQVWPS
ncbi:unnamed protein product [Polarella glacialis]|uniref:Aspartyl/asparaginy/proline hydroxylase domain-containing protein n=1 Tax=Polarella glacialis TaxID=89957 RepID=A0A813LQH1_POLGL|nr:unnamed protein product [Polarella glacialis]